jgi:hypothetical protein
LAIRLLKVNRDRGEAHGASPPTLPGIQVHGGSAD